MRDVKRALPYLSFVVAGSLAGCAGLPTEVVDVMADKNGYLNSEFAPDKLPADVRKEFSDAGAVNFKTMVVTSVPVMEDRPKDQPVPDLKNITTLQNAGGGLVQRMEDFTSNGIETMVGYSLSYYDFLPVRSQDVPANTKHANFMLTVKSFQRFEAIRPNDATQTSFGYDMETGFADPMNLAMATRDLSASRQCTWKESAAAATIHSALQGDARFFECELANNNHIVTGHVRFAYLLQYGVALQVHSDNAQHRFQFNIVDVSVN